MARRRKRKSRIWERRSGRTVLRQSFRALRHRPFRLMFAGMGVSWIGTWMQQVAISWLVYRLTGSALLLGVIAFVSQFPAFIVAPFAGVLADRLSKVRIVLVTQALAMLQAATLAALVLTGAVEIWHVIALTALLGVVSGFDIPARQSLLIELVEGPEDLPNAIALNSSLFNGARLVGPAIAGILIAVIGEGLVILLNAVTYLAVFFALLGIGIPPRRARDTQQGARLRHLREGLGYATGFFPIRTILTLLAVMSLLAMPYVVLLPVFATEILHGGPDTLGFLVSATGLGALAGALFLASRSSVRGLSQVIIASLAIFGLGLLGFALSRSLPLSLALLLLAGFGMMTTTAAINTILQTIVEPAMRGRVMSFYMMAFMGMTPFGSLVAGALASRVGATATVLVGGVAALGAAAWFARERSSFRREIRPIYVRLGIIPEVAEGLRSATDQRRP